MVGDFRRPFIHRFRLLRSCCAVCLTSADDCYLWEGKNTAADEFYEWRVERKDGEDTQHIRHRLSPTAYPFTVIPPKAPLGTIIFTLCTSPAPKSTTRSTGHIPPPLSRGLGRLCSAAAAAALAAADASLASSYTCSRSYAFSKGHPPRKQTQTRQGGSPPEKERTHRQHLTRAAQPGKTRARLHYG